MADLTNQAVHLAIKDLERDLIEAGRQYEDAEMAQDAHSMSYALQQYNLKQGELERLTGSGQGQQQSGLSEAQKEFISRRIKGGDDMSPAREQDYYTAHARAVNAGWQIDSPQYFAAVAGHLDSMGDGRQRPLDEREAAKLCGLTPEEYAQGAAQVRALRRAGYYQD
jgi:hypothetical protein